MEQKHQIIEFVRYPGTFLGWVGHGIEKVFGSCNKFLFDN